MRKIYALLVVMGCAVTLKAQIVFNDNFSGYAIGDLNGKGPAGATWASSGVGTDVQVAGTTPLVYPGYASGSQYVTISGTSSVVSAKSFSTSINISNARSIFVAFTVRVTSSNDPAGSSIRLLDANADINAAKVLCSFYAERNGSGVSFGLNIIDNDGTFTRVMTPGSFAFNTTYLIVIRYDKVNGNNNDDIRLWVNPSLGSTGPDDGDADVTINSSNDENETITSVGRLQIRQTTGTQGTPVAAYDGFKVAHGATPAAAWTNLSPQGAPLPVKLDNFDAAKDVAGIKVYWNSSDEIGVKSYQVERSEDGLNFSAIGTVAAEKKKSYSFVDGQPSANSNFYRLKMIDFDGNFKLSHVVSIKSKAALNIILSPNPVVDRMLVQHPKADNNNRIQVINVDGKVLIETRVPANAVQTNIDLSFVRAGLYHVVFQSEAGVFSKTIFKQ